MTTFKFNNPGCNCCGGGGCPNDCLDANSATHSFCLRDASVALGASDVAHFKNGVGQFILQTEMAQASLPSIGICDAGGGVLSVPCDSKVCESDTVDVDNFGFPITYERCGRSYSTISRVDNIDTDVQLASCARANPGSSPYLVFATSSALYDPPSGLKYAKWVGTITYAGKVNFWWREQMSNVHLKTQVRTDFVSGVPQLPRKMRVGVSMTRSYAIGMQFTGTITWSGTYQCRTALPCSASYLAALNATQPLDAVNTIDDFTTECVDPFCIYDDSGTWWSDWRDINNCRDVDASWTLTGTGAAFRVFDPAVNVVPWFNIVTDFCWPDWDQYLCVHWTPARTTDTYPVFGDGSSRVYLIDLIMPRSTTPMTVSINLCDQTIT